MLAASTPGAARQAPRWPVDLPPAVEPESGAMCVAPDPEGRIRKTVTLTGEAVSFRQQPSLLLARDDHGLELQRFVVLGDVERVQFDRWDADTNDFVAETWTRSGSDTLNGRLVSIFTPSWPAAIVQQRLNRARVGFDQPSVYWGRYRGPMDALLPAAQAVTLRVGSSALQPATVVRIDDSAQYASHVVNLVMPSFADSAVGGSLDVRPVAKRFYELFEDSYDVLAVVPFEAQMDAAAAAYHQRVRTDVTGVGLPVFNQTAQYGSSGRLQGVEVFLQASFPDNGTSAHELGHTWGHAFDWTRIANITRAGHHPSAHAPLMTGGESMIGAVLRPTRRAVIKEDGTAVIERTTAMARQHPLDLYAMGLVGPGDLGAFTLFLAQDQFSASTSSTPAAGTAITGERRAVTINDVMAAHGAREGPVPAELQRATIVVSQDRLLTPEELGYWNAYAARHEDAGGTGVVSYDGIGSFASTTAGRVRLTTGIRPRDAAPAPFRGEAEPARFGPLDCRGFEFTTAPPTRVRAGERFTVAGRITARDRSDFSQVMFRFWPSDDVSERAERAYAEASRAGEFRTEVEIRPGREGQYTVEGFLFWPDAAPQYSRCRLSVVNVTP